jgi:long-chain acyl-CoA synthetase
MEHALLECGAETAIVLTLYYDKLKGAQPDTVLRRIIATNIKEYLPLHLRILFTLLREKKEGHRITLQQGDFWLGDLLRRYAGSPRPPVTVRPSDPAILFFSGGTTGVPKAAVGTHHALFISGLQIQTWFKSILQEWTDVIAAAMPFFHVYGNAGVMATGLVGHHPLAIVPNPRDLDDLLAMVKRDRPAFLPGVPTLFIALLNHPDVQAGKVDMKPVKLCIAGAAPLLAETKQRFEALTGGRVVEGYALTETMMGAVINPVVGSYRPGSTGLPLPDIEVRVGDSDSGMGNLPGGEIGEICIRAPQLMTGYWQRPADTADTIHDGWLHTGDLGYLDEDGYLYIVDRKKDVIKPGGFQVWPREVEEVIASLSEVAEVAVAGVPDAYQGEAVGAWVVLRSGEQITAEAIQNYCRDRVAAYKVPRYIEFRTSLPKTTIGKVLRRELVREFAETRAAELSPAEQEMIAAAG